MAEGRAICGDPGRGTRQADRLFLFAAEVFLLIWASYSLGWPMDKESMMPEPGNPNFDKSGAIEPAKRGSLDEKDRDKVRQRLREGAKKRQAEERSRLRKRHSAREPEPRLTY
jgi:hypothetical protein